MKIETLEGWHDSKHERMKIAAAIIGGAVVAGGASIFGSAEQSSSASNAANLQESQFNQTQQNLAPYNQAGQAALSTIGQDQATSSGFAAPFNFTADPGYNFQLQQGQNAINSSAAATGGVLNGGTLKALDQYTTGLANTTYGDAYSRYLAGSQQQYNQLMGVAQTGESAAAMTGSLGANAANAAGNYTTQAGNAAAAGGVGVGNAINSGINNSILYQGLQQSQSGYGNYSGPNNMGIGPANGGGG